MLDLVLTRERFVVVAKPAGWLVHEGWARDGPTVVDALRERGFDHPHAVHRIDRAASGLVLVALDAKAASQLQAALAAPESEKVYLALVRGRAPEKCDLSYPLRPLTKSGKKDSEAPRRPARTVFRRLGTDGKYSLVQARLFTGRTHQIRRHLKHLSHPIIGDVRYGKGAHNRFFREQHGLHRLALHAYRLKFKDPELEEWIELELPLPADLATTCVSLGLAAPTGADAGGRSGRENDELIAPDASEKP